MKQPTILIIDDEENLRHMLSVMLQKNGYQTDLAADGEEGLALLEQHSYNYILCDIRMPVMDGREFLRQAVQNGISTPIIMMTAYGNVETAVTCMQEGAYDFISKPFKQDEIIIVLKKAEERERLKAENLALKAAVADQNSFHGMVGRNQSMLALFEQIRRVSSLKTTVLILGESGTGKELVAKALHNGGIRSNGPFVAVNCGAIPETMLEGELFGHVKGAFTGALADKPGLLEQSDGGTLFLDEVGEMPLALQVKLLRVLQEGELRRLGALQSKTVDLRVVSATARDLQEEVRAGRFREDLYFRLNVFTLQLPPMRERIDDLPLIARQLLEGCAERIGLTDPPGLAPEVLHRLLRYHWPGNVRELENIIERALVLCDGDLITAAHLPEELVGASGADIAQAGGSEEESLSIKQAERLMEIDLISKALIRTSGNRTQAAKILEISHRSLLYKIKEYGLQL